MTFVDENGALPLPKAYNQQRGYVGSFVPVKESGDSLKKDDNKARFDLIPAEALIPLAELFALGAKKYSDRKWEEGMNWGRLFGAMMRHGWKWWLGEEYDQVDGQHHLTSVAWCALCLYTYFVRKSGTDDRPR